MLVCGFVLNFGMFELEEFLLFKEFYIEKFIDGSVDVIIYVLMDSFLVLGVYCMDIIKGMLGQGQKMVILLKLFFCNLVEWLGVVLLILMYWYFEINCVLVFDWCLEVYDVDGLMMVMGNGEQIWCLLMNLLCVVIFSFVMENLQGFGLIQCDCWFENYEDDGVFYDKCVLVWIVFKGDWGKGQIQLIEILIDDEIYDNIVLFWNLEEKL